MCYIFFLLPEPCVLNRSSSCSERQVTVTIEVPGRDDAYHWLVQWLNEHPYSKTSRQLLVQTDYDAHDSEREPRLLFTPAIGEHVLKYKGKWVWLSRQREDTPDIALGGRHESITLSAFGRDRSLFINLIQDAMRLAQMRDHGKLILHSVVHGEWRRFGEPEEPRPLSSIFLDHDVNGMDVKKELLDDLAKFLAARDWSDQI